MGAAPPGQDAPAVGLGRSAGHHGELLQGAFATADGGVRRGLVTLPCPLFEASATALLRPGSGRVACTPPWRTKGARAAELTLSLLGLHETDVELHLESTLPTGRGFGSSTADVTATIRAVLDATSRSVPEEALARVAVEAELASDPLMIDRVVLFAHRDGLILEEIGPRLPSLAALGFPTSARFGAGVETLGQPSPDYTDDEIRAFSRLRIAMRRAVVEDDAHLLGDVASESASLNQRHLPVPRLAELERIVERSDALGLQVAHSGDIAGLLFADGPATPDQMGDAEARLREAGITDSWRFGTGERVAGGQEAVLPSAR